MERPEYYGILPSKVRYDERLKPMEKIMFSELTALVRKKGYCYASNMYFAALYGVHKSTVSAWISNLAKCGHITTKCIMKDKRVEERRIYIVDIKEINQAKKEVVEKILERKVKESKKEEEREVIEKDVEVEEKVGTNVFIAVNV